MINIFKRKSEIKYKYILIQSYIRNIDEKQCQYRPIEVENIINNLIKIKTDNSLNFNFDIIISSSKKMFLIMNSPEEQILNSLIKAFVVTLDVRLFTLIDLSKEQFEERQRYFINWEK